ncbi:MAG: hypothetical protein Athens101426_48 [Parcubacteria group bacterium Athens1014_26]|nr:MAG: hypothetical protein Athens101426_48 [Parcubacteria group bacterium Athens1014_26]
MIVIFITFLAYQSSFGRGEIGEMEMKCIINL